MKKIVVSLFLSLFSISTVLCTDIPKSNNKNIFTKIDCQIQPLALTEKGYRKSKTQPGYGFTSPRISPKGISTKSLSLNWSGYTAVTNLKKPKKHTVKYVKGTWTVPTITSSITDAYTASWVGIDGYSNSTVEQIGTESDSICGAQSNYAWFEMYPQEAFLIVDFPVNAGDVIRGSVKHLHNGVFELTLANITQRVYTVIPKRYTKNKHAERSSAEWIVEAPSSQSNVLPLANFSPITFINCKAIIKGKEGFIKNDHWKKDAINMIDTNGNVIATTSPLSEDKNFSVTRQSNPI